MLKYGVVSPLQGLRRPPSPLSFKMSKMGRQIKNFLSLAAIFGDFLDFGPIYKVINKSAQEQSPEEKKT